MIFKMLVVLLTFPLLSALSTPPDEDPTASQKLFAAARQMQQALQSMESAEQEAWKGYFDWANWGPRLVEQKTLDTEQLQAILPKFYGFRKGLDNAAFLRFRAELKSYLQGTEVPTIIGSSPSLYVRMDKSVVDDSLAKKATTRDDQSFSQNQIAGAWVTGPAYSHMEVKAHLIPYRENVAIEVKLSGTVNSPQNIASKGRFRVYGSSVSHAQGVAFLLFKDGAFHPTPPHVTVNTDSQFQGVDGPPLLRRIAMRQAYKRESQGEAEGSEIVRQEVTRQFTQELAAEVEEVNKKLQKYENYTAIFQAFDIVPSKIEPALVQDTLSLGLSFGDSGAEKAPGARTLAKESPLELSLHQTFLSAFPRKYLKGAWWSEKEFGELRKDLHPSLTEAILPAVEKTEGEAWGARWDWGDPVAIEIRDGLVECKLAFSHARIHDQWNKAGLLLTAKFRPETETGKIGFRRVGEVQIASRKPNSELSSEEIAFFKKKFDEICGDFIPLNSLNPAAGITSTAVSLFTTTNASLEDGWIHLNYQKTDRPLAKLISK